MAGGELLIPTFVLLFGADIKPAGSLSLAAGVPTMLVGFARYRRDRSFVVFSENGRFVVVMAAGSIFRSFIGGRLLGRTWWVLAEHTEVESGKRDDRPELAKALHTYRLTGAALIIAKLDRLSRDAAFLLNLEKAGVEFIAAGMPGANRLTVRLMAVIAQEEREMILVRTRPHRPPQRHVGSGLTGAGTR